MSNKFKELVLLAMCFSLSGCMENKEDRVLLVCGIASGIAAGAALSNRQTVVVRGRINGKVMVQNGKVLPIRDNAKLCSSNCN